MQNKLMQFFSEELRMRSIFSMFIILIGLQARIVLPKDFVFS
jgi:hypothetical protein